MAVPPLAKLGIFFLSLIIILCKCSASDILGCGGFVKSHTNLDYSKIEIGLYTKDGSLKEKTECAPTNGYYFLPLYETGEYVLRAHPPAGWSVEPARVELAVDGERDACSTGQDINFSFNGFGITGKVNTAGQTQGPAGVSVQLVSEKGEKWETVTTAGGDYHFTPVIPGKYTVKASHPRWQLQPSQTVVQVKEGNTVMPQGSLTVKGYEVRGSVVSHGNPVSGFYVMLYSKEARPKLRVEGCTSLLLQGVSEAPLCHVTTDSRGEFSFGLVPGGAYRLAALARPPGQDRVTYVVRPETVEVLVQHYSLYIKEAFEITSFTVSGAVGAGAGGARVLLGGAAAAAADAAGRYTLRGLAPGDYTVAFQHEHCELEDVQLSVSAAGRVALPDAPVARWKVCGSVSPPGALRVAVSADRGGRVDSVAVNDDGSWCAWLPRGAYAARVEVPEGQGKGMQFYPPSSRFTVDAGPVSGVSFGRLRGTVRGEVRGARGAVRVTLTHLDGGDTQTTTAVDGAYTFTSVPPGAISVSADGARRCWDRAALPAAVAAPELTLPPLTQRGLALPVRASHDVELDYSSESHRGSLSLRAGAGAGAAGAGAGAAGAGACVPAAGRYVLRPRSCHVFDKEEYVVDVTEDGDVEPLVLRARAHRQTVSVRSPAAAADLTLSAAVSRRGAPARQAAAGPLEPRADGDEFVYTHDLYLAEDEVALVSAHSESLLFAPAEVRAGGADCGAAPALQARRARLVQGRVTPPVEGVEITLTDEDTGARRTFTTGADGAYRFPGVEAAARVSLAAAAPGWALTVRGSDVLARRLAELRASVTDEQGRPLADGVVSVSGGAYRHTASLAGGARFAPLSPGQYYVKPQLQEHRAAPPHQLVDLKDGEALDVTFVGTRVAWSVFGTVSTLGGAGVSDVTVVAEPEPAAADGADAADAPRCAAERATPDHSGAFRIRGLLPSCVYHLRLRPAPAAPAAAALRLAAPAPRIEITAGADVTGVRLVAVPALGDTDVTVLVRAAREHYRSLTLRLAPDGGAAVHAARPDGPGLHCLPRLPSDRRLYALSLESSLPRTAHDHEDQVVYFTADGEYKNFTFEFAPRVKTSEQELRQSSLLILPLLALASLAFLHREALVDAAVRAAGRALGPRNVAPRAVGPRAPARAPARELLDAASIDQIVSSVNAAGKRVGKKKAQLAM